MTSRYIAKTFFGLEECLGAEIKSLGGQDIKLLNRAVSFSADLKTLYTINLRARTALRVLKPLLSFSAHNEVVLYKRLRRFDWSTLFGLNQTFAIDPVVNSKFFRHSKYIGLKVKDAIVDQFREANRGKRPSIDTDRPDYRINVHCRDKDFTLSIDSSGQSLHRRGYRFSGREAPLNEALAAGMILLSGWDKKQALFDPMCGSGTILAEAALIATDQAPRHSWNWFGFMNWQDYNPAIWNSVVAESKSKVQALKTSLFGADESRKEVFDAYRLFRQMGLEDIEVRTSDFFKSKPPSSEGLIIMNPPYGKRLQKDEIENFYKRIGDVFKQEYAGWTAWILSANKEAIKKVGLRTSKKYTLYNGPLECKFHKYEMYSGSRK